MISCRAADHLSERPRTRNKVWPRLSR